MSIIHTLSRAELLELLERIGVYDVECDRCGKVGLTCDYVVEEGDEWECWSCYERIEEQEAVERARLALGWSSAQCEAADLIAQEESRAEYEARKRSAEEDYQL